MSYSFNSKMSLSRFTFKVSFVGPSGSGKSSIIYRYREDAFLFKMPPTVGAPFYTKTVEKDQKAFVLRIWDTAGQERFAELIPLYYRNSHCIVLCFEHGLIEEVVTDQIDKQIKKELSELPPLLILGNKYDLVEQDLENGTRLREIVSETLKSYQLEEGSHYTYLDCSAKSGLNLKEAGLFEEKLLESLETQQKKSLVESKESSGSSENVSIEKPKYEKPLCSRKCC